MSGEDHNNTTETSNDPLERVVEALAEFWPVRSAMIGGVHKDDRDKWLLEVAAVAVDAARGEVAS